MKWASIMGKNKPRLTSAGEDMEKPEPSHTVCGDGNDPAAMEQLGRASKC